ncbi:MAG: ABC transporter permease [Persicimonas sp.]
MSNLLSTFRLLVLTAARSVVSHRMKSLIVGFILMFGTALLVVGTSLLDSVEESMQRTVTQSLAGHLQVYSAEANDQLALFGEVAFGGDDVGEMQDFARVREVLEDVDNVRAVVPMGMTQARFVIGNRIDELLAELRRASSQERWEEVETLEVQMRAMAADLRREQQGRAEITSEPERYEENLAALDRVLDDRFWDVELREESSDALFFLDTKIAPLDSDGRLIILRVLGTDPGRFEQHFDRFRIVRGEMIPPGEHGVLVSERTYDSWLKNRAARTFDTLHEELYEEDRTLADDEILRGDVERLQKQYGRVTFGLPPGKVDQIEQRVAEFLGRPQDQDADGIKDVLTEFFALTDANFQERYDFFYDEIAPLMRLYEFEVGQTLTLQAFSRRGFARSANVKVWGTFEFEGMEDSRLAGSVQVIDMPTFRTLYGAMTKEALAELDEIRQEVGVDDVRREGAEDALFGGGDELVVEQEDDALGQSDEADEADQPAVTVNRDGRDGYDPTKIDQGLARNAAILLEDPSKLKQTHEEVRRAIERNELELKVIDWQAAAGIVGQFVIVIRLALLIAIGIIFLVAMVIINNSMVMATVERTSEIGTMRAIGAKRWYVMALFLIETLILGVAAGLAGCGLGVLVIWIAGQTGIPATTSFLRFLFAGDTLYPSLSTANVLWAFLAIQVISTLSTLYPARLATRIQPIVAIRGN